LYTGGSLTSKSVLFAIVYSHIPSHIIYHEVAAVCRRSPACVVDFLSTCYNILLGRDSVKCS